MRRLAYALAAVLAVAAAPSARAEALDVDLRKLGPPSADTWVFLASTVAGVSAGQAETYATESRRRFATFATELGLALSSAVGQPAATTGSAGFAVDLEIAMVPVGTKTVGAAPAAGYTSSTWATSSAPPSAIYVPSLHVRKGLPWSFEFGGRLLYLNQSSYYAAQAEAKWAVHEGFEAAPDVAIRAAYTRLFGQEDLSLGVTDVDAIVSKRFGLNALSAITPSLALRYTIVAASTRRIDFAPALGAGPLTQASFPQFTAGYFRPTLGVRYAIYAVVLGLEGTFLLESAKSSNGYSGVKARSPFAGTAQLGWEF
jgi:hypothetical protein